MGPAEFLTGTGIDVRPHPHIGLGTVTYLLKGRLHHRDSLGTDAWIEPGAVNWMMAGQGITHSERTDGEARKAPLSMFGLQTWLALPKDREEDAAGFAHLGRDALPEMEGEGKEVRLILGHAWGEKVALDMPSEVFYADARLAPGAAIPLPDDHEDRGVYILDGEVTCAGQVFEAGRMLVFRPGDRVSVKAGAQGARVMLLGGATMDGPRFIWWNFVASSREKIDAAREAWRAGDWMHGRFKLPQGDDAEFIPAPDR
jgi:redox-sensitive bicupin YhaK (pirin superfamily)